MDESQEPNAPVVDHLLLAYDRALADGSVPSQDALGPSDIDAVALAEFRRQQRCLQRLETLWPRHLLTQSSLTCHTEALALADQFRQMPEEELRLLPPITTPEDLKQAVVESGLISRDDLETLLEDFFPMEGPDGVESLVYELIQRKLLTGRQMLILWRRDLRTLVLGEHLILEEIGRGGMGVVYRALDRKSNVAVALKTLLQPGADSILRLKQEFRSLADLIHPNLVVLDELRCIGDHWFFTMELVSGRHLTEYVRGEARPIRGTPSGPSCMEPPRPPITRGPLTTPEQFQRLNQSLQQLAEGLCALHRAGKLHRDIKPANVLVDEEGRVVLVDFGLASDLRPPDAEQPAGQHAAGTLAYMSPEQAAGQPLSEASDWYSVGVMLYEILFGRRPFEGSRQQILDQKRMGPPRPHGETAAAEHADLVALCLELLEPLPEARPPEAEILRRLLGEGNGATEPRSAALPRPESVFVGREEHIDSLGQAYTISAEGRLSWAHVHGPPGIGKTAVVEHFLRQLERQEDVLVLRGRCYERESVPYRALDSIVDGLAARLTAWPAEDAARLAPLGIGPLVQMFPVLGRVPWLSPQRPGQDAGKSQEARRAAIEALRGLLRHLSAVRHVVLAVDDLQWEDADGSVLLSDLVSPPDPPPLLLVTCGRTEDAARNRPLQGLLARLERVLTPEGRREIALGPLNLEEGRQLAHRLMAPATPGFELAAEVARESGGNPYLLTELVRHADHAASPTLGRVDLATVLLDRVGTLPDPVQQLLDLVAVAGHPLRVVDACRAARVEAGPRMLINLAVQRLVRTRGEGAGRTIEAYHDRVREILAGRRSALEQCELHRRLALELERSPAADPQLLFTHFDAANEPGKAGHYALLAADRAVASLAFDQAARLYQRALELDAVAPDHAHEVRKRLAQALADAGRSVESAGEFQAAAAGFSGVAALDLQRQAAELLLRAGRLDEGCRLLSRVLSAVGLRMPRSAFQAKLMAFVNHLRLRLRGTRYRERPEHEIAPEELARLDACWSATVLVNSDGLRGLPFVVLFPRLALQVGEPYRVSLALAQLGVQRGFAGDWEDALEIFGRAESLARRLNRPHARAYVRGCLGFVHLMRGEWREALRCSDEADAILGEQSGAVHLERSAFQVVTLRALFFAGEVREIARRVPLMIEDARRREDALAAAVPYTYFGNVAWLAADDAGQARAHAREVLARFPAAPFLQQHLFELVGSVQIDLYLGDGRAAEQRIAGAWPRYRQSVYRGIPVYRTVLHHLRARAALAAIDVGENDAGLLRSAVYYARKLEHERMAWCDPLAGLVRAGVAAASGQRELAAELVRRAIDQCDAADMPLFAMAGRRQQGRLLGGQEGQALIREADAWMEGRGIRVPWRFAAMLAPGFGGRELL